MYLYNNIPGGVIKDVVMRIFSFSTIPYGWYVEMWIGLFLMVPFLNILWWNCPSKKQTPAYWHTL